MLLVLLVGVCFEESKALTEECESKFSSLWKKYLTKFLFLLFIFLFNEIFYFMDKTSDCSKRVCLTQITDKPKHRLLSPLVAYGNRSVCWVTNKFINKKYEHVRKCIKHEKIIKKKSPEVDDFHNYAQSRSRLFMFQCSNILSILSIYESLQRTPIIHIK